jgi:hypothetical protein
LYFSVFLFNKESFVNSVLFFVLYSLLCIFEISYVCENVNGGNGGGENEKGEEKEEAEEAEEAEVAEEAEECEEGEKEECEEEEYCEGNIEK